MTARVWSGWGWRLPAWVPCDGTLEGLKGLGLMAMTVDHVNTFLLASSWPAGFAFGRLAMPIFVIVLGINLARPGGQTVRYHRILSRLAVAGLLATPFHVALGGAIRGAWPLNILFTLALITAVVWGLQGSRLQQAGAWVLLLVGGMLVEYFWIGVVLGVAAWRYARRPSFPAAALGLAAMAGLSGINGNGWAWLALPLLAVATRLRLPIRRHREVFYVYYPLHLAVLWAIRWLSA